MEEAEESPPLLPWLEAIDEDEHETKSRPSGLLGFGLAAAALVTGLGIYAFATRNPTPTDLAGPVDSETPPDLLDSPAPLTDTPDSPAPVTKKSDSSVTAVAKPGKAPAPRDAAAPVRRSAPVRTSPSAAKEAGAASSIQLASYYSKRRAEEYWTLVSGRHKQLAALDHQTVTGSVEGRTVYRLRAFGRGEAEICQRLQSRGVPCLRIGSD